MSAMDSDSGDSIFVTQDKFSLDKSLSYDTDSAIDAVFFLENLESSDLIAENDHTSMPNQELQVGNISGYPQFSDISNDELLQATQTIEQKYFESNMCIKTRKSQKTGSRAQLVKNKQESCQLKGN